MSAAGSPGVGVSQPRRAARSSADQLTAVPTSHLECVVNVSEGRDFDLVQAIGDAAGRALLDVHSDAWHHRSVYTLGGPSELVRQAARDLAATAVGLLDLRLHDGVHPRLGVVDVVPFVPLDKGAVTDDAVADRDGFSSWFAEVHGVPCFLYGPERTLPEVRRGAFVTLAPDFGPPAPHPSAGACCVGARGVLVAYNLLIADDLEVARRVARSLRRPEVRALGLRLGGLAQVSCNLVAPEVVGPAEVYDLVAGQAHVVATELVGLLPAAVLARIDPARWDQLDLAEDRTIEARLERRC